jgi:hypothetical protein
VYWAGSGSIAAPGICGAFHQKVVMPLSENESCACLRVITLADKVTILNAFPDRGFKP